MGKKNKKRLNGVGAAKGGRQTAPLLDDFSAGSQTGQPPKNEAKPAPAQTRSQRQQSQAATGQSSGVATTAAQSGVWDALRATGKKGILTTVLVLILLIYVIWGLLVYSAGPGTGSPKSLPALYSYFPSASVVLQSNNEAYVTWKAAIVALAIGVVALVVMAISSRLRNRIALIVVGITTVLLAAWALPQYDRWHTSYGDYVQRYKTLKRYSVKQAQISQQQNGQNATAEEDLRAQALQQVILFRYSEQLATKQDVKISDADVEKSYQDYVKKAGGEATLERQLKDYLGWTTAEYKQELRQQMLQQKLNEKLQYVYKGEADAAKQDLKTTKVKSYVKGLVWDAKLRNVQVK